MMLMSHGTLANPPSAGAETFLRYSTLSTLQRKLIWVLMGGLFQL